MLRSVVGLLSLSLYLSLYARMGILTNDSLSLTRSAQSLDGWITLGGMHRGLCTYDLFLFYAKRLDVSVEPVP